MLDINQALCYGRPDPNTGHITVRNIDQKKVFCDLKRRTIMSQRESTYLYYPYAVIAKQGGGGESVGHDRNDYSLRSRLKLS